MKQYLLFIMQCFKGGVDKIKPLSHSSKGGELVLNTVQGLKVVKTATKTISDFWIGSISYCV
jgi:hypothetical protein